VWRRLAKDGLAVRVSGRVYEVIAKVPKRALKRARRT
jgi:hypothetical protein